MKLELPVLLAANGGYVDTAGFLALHGLFTAHVTGNFVTLGAALALGTAGAVGKLLALPVFCAVVVAVRLLGYVLAARGIPQIRTLFAIKLAFLALGCVLAIWLGPFTNPDDFPALLTGMILVTAMAIQNAAHRIHLASSPPSTLMTGTTTQVMIDLGDLLHGISPEQKAGVQARLLRMSGILAAFAVGCGAAALLFAGIGVWCFAVPPLVALWAHRLAPSQD